MAMFSYSDKELFIDVLPMTIGSTTPDFNWKNLVRFGWSTQSQAANIPFNNSSEKIFLCSQILQNQILVIHNSFPQVIIVNYKKRLLFFEKDANPL
jgi:hypothetical protein